MEAWPVWSVNKVAGDRVMATLRRVWSGRRRSVKQIAGCRDQLAEADGAGVSAVDADVRV
jgi:hypothetical protein